MAVAVIHLMPTLMERQLDPSAGYLLQKAIERRGIDVLTSANTQVILGETKVEGVKLDDCRIVPADIVVMAVGIRPNARLAKEAGLAVGRGIKVDDAMRTSDADIFAVGECVEHRGQCYGLVAPLYEMAKVLAAQLAGENSASYPGSVTSTKLKVTGIDLFSAGDFSEGDESDEIVLRDPSRGVYKRIVLRNKQIVGAVLYGDTGDGPWLFDLLKKEKMTNEETIKVRLAAKCLLYRLREESPKVLVQDWFKDVQSKSQVRSAVEKVLDAHLPKSYDRAVFTEKCNNVFESMLDYASQGLKWAA